MGDSPFAIQTFDLSKEFNGVVAVDRLGLGIREGELFSLLGPNGAGKTTTINMLCCLLQPTSGSAEIMGYDILKEPFRVRELIGVSPQETAISGRLNSWENLSLIGKVHNIPAGELKERSESHLGLYRGAQGQKDHPAHHSLYGGSGCPIRQDSDYG
jgi:ABC-2 type transport system ATP-binding protein